MIDFWIALESLFLPDDGRVQEKAETAAMVVAHYIGKTASERTTIRNAIKRSQVVRSHLVHGKPGHPPHDFAEMTTNTMSHHTVVVCHPGARSSRRRAERCSTTV